MDEKLNESLLPPIKEHMVTIPNDVQQLTIKDSTVFIGKDRSYHSKSRCARGLIILTLLLAITVTAILLQPTAHYFNKIFGITGSANSDVNPSFNGNTPSPLSAAMNNIARMFQSPPGVFSQDDFRSTSSKSDVTILYSFRDPKNDLSEFFELTSVYIARANRTTLSFYIHNNAGCTYLDDVSVNNTYGGQLIVNGGFDNGTYGWQGLYSYSTCYPLSYYNYYSRQSSNCAQSNDAVGSTLSQTFNTTPGATLYIGFKLRWSGSGPGVINQVTIYP